MCPPSPMPMTDYCQQIFLLPVAWSDFLDGFGLFLTGTYLRFCMFTILGHMYYVWIKVWQNILPKGWLPQVACFLQWSDFRKKVGNPTKCPILVRIWSDLKVFRGIWRNLVEILRFIYMIMYFICISTLNIAVFWPCAAINFSQSTR